MRFLRTNTATVITVGPFLDKTDGVTPETALTVTSCQLTLVVDNGGSPVLALDAAATASGGSNDMVHVANDDAGYYTLELTAANLNYLGGAQLSINDTATHVPVFHELMIIPAHTYDAMFGGTDYLQVDMVQVEGSDATDQINAAVDAAWTTQMADSVPSDGSIATREQAMYMIAQFLFERAVSGTTVTVAKVDGSTSLFTLTVNDASSPTSITRTT